MAFQQYNSLAYKKQQEEYEKHLAKKMSEEEDKRQKKYGFMLEPPNVIPNYMDAPAKKGEGNLGVDTIREGKIYTPEPTGDDRMSPALRNVLHPPVIGDRIDSKTILLKPSAKKSNSRTAKKWARDRRNFTLKKGKKGKKTRDPPPAKGGRRKRRKTRRNKRSKKHRGKKRKTRKRRKKRR